MPTNQVNLLKLAVNVVASASVWKVVNDVIQNNVTIQTNVDVAKVLTPQIRPNSHEKHSL